MSNKTFTVPNIGCDGCVRTIKNELSQLPGVQKVDGSVANKTITIEWIDPTDWQQIVNTLNEIDYAPAES